MKRIQQLIQFLLTNFGPLIGFYLLNNIWGLQTAILGSMGIVVAELIWIKVIRKGKVSSLFLFSGAIVFVFGALDLWLQQSLFFKLEAFLINLFTAVFFGLSLRNEKSLIQELAETQKRTSSDQSEDKRFFFQLLTIFWCLYFIAKGFFFLWLNFTTPMNEALLLRMIIGKVSFWIMLFVSIWFSRPLFRLLEQRQMLPSQKVQHRAILTD